MKGLFFPKLAWSGIRKNGRLYLPYLLTSIGVIGMYTITVSLRYSEFVRQTRGSEILTQMLGFGSWILILFSAIFLFYTYSFLTRRRRKEFGLYNILGMGKGGIARIMIWETLITAGISIPCGLATGGLFCKLAELLLGRLVNAEVSYELSFFSPQAVRGALIAFGAIYLLNFLNSLRQLRASAAIQLLRSENTGEKPPKANWVLGVGGVLLLAAAYAIAVLIKDPLTAILLFFVAVAMVVVATYAVFISGSVLLCRILQKDKRYYYRKNHFVSVSSMAFRMKRNGAGLASICILLTMVLVSIASTSCLYFGNEDSLNTRFPRQFLIDVGTDSFDSLAGEAVTALRGEIDEAAQNCGIEPSNRFEYRCATINGQLIGETAQPDSLNADIMRMDQVRQFYFVPLEDYNRVMGTDYALKPGEALLYTLRCRYDRENIRFADLCDFRIVGRLNGFVDEHDMQTSLVPAMLLVIDAPSETLAPFMKLTIYDGTPMLTTRWTTGFDTDAEDNAQQELFDEINTALNARRTQEIRSIGAACKTVERDDFVASSGSFFFLGILLSLVFLFAAVMIIYYKQICEGYEDRSRFAIMQKVGMTKKDIRSSINSQMLTVFFLPLFFAVLHLAFAFPMVRKLLMLFMVTNLKLLLVTTGITVLAIAAIYAAVYRMTSRAYFSIVSGKDEE